MRRRGLRVAALVAAAVVVLFAGRRLTLFLSDVWWAREFSPAGAGFLAQWHYLRLLLDTGATLIACAWFIGNLFIVYRALGMVQVPRYLANLEFREAVTPNLLLAGAIALGLVFGVLAGSGASEWWPTVSLAWQGAPFAIPDPLLGKDLGVYVAQLPMWRTLRAFAVLLLAVGGAIVITLYMLVGSLRWVDGRPAISDHARAHLGGLLAAGALCLAWGYSLEPYELVAGLRSLSSFGAWEARSLGAQILTGTSLAAAVVSLVWAFRPKHALVLAGWVVLIVAAGTHRFIAPAVLADGRPLAAAADRWRLQQIAFGLDSLGQYRLAGASGWPAAAPPEMPWDTDRLGELVAVDSARLLAAAPATIRVQGTRRPAWLAVVQRRMGPPFLAAIAADRLTAGGGVTSYQAAESDPYPSVLPYVELSANALRPGAPRYRIDGGPGGVAAGSWFRRLVLAWGFQAGGVLGDIPEEAHIHWLLDPATRLRRLAPFASWSTAEPRISEGRLLWVARGYLAGASFPLTPRIRWVAGVVGYLRPGLIGVVDAETGASRVFLSPHGGPVAEAWAALADGLVEPVTAIPPEMLATLSYPPEWFEIQALMVGRESLGPEPGAAEPVGDGVAVRWRQGGEPGPVLQEAFHASGSRTVSAVVEGRIEAGVNVLSITRVDSSASLPTPAVLRQRWGRLPISEQVQDSLRREGASLQAGDIVYLLAGDRLLAAAPYYGLRSGARPVMAWAALAAGPRLGAGRTFREAWSNLVGETAPLPPGGSPPGALEEAQRWMRLADSAFRAGDWEAFGRAFGALREVLRIEERPVP